MSPAKGGLAAGHEPRLSLRSSGLRGIRIAIRVMAVSAPFGTWTRLLAAGIVAVAVAAGAVAGTILWGSSEPKRLQLAHSGEPMQLAETQQPAPKQSAPAPKQQPQAQ